MKTNQLDATLVKTMRKNGLLRTEGFGLFDGFIGEYEIRNIRPFKSRSASDDDDVDNFAVDVKTPIGGSASISGFQISNARLLKGDFDGKTINEDAKGIYFQDEVSDKLQDSVLFNSQYDDDEGFNFPNKLEVVGAVVIKDEDSGKPAIPLRRYKHYSQVLRHHRKVTQEPNAFLTRDDFKSYLKMSGDNRPVGLPEDYKKPELANSVKADDMSNWTFTLLVKDTNEE
jgi:hypothetical protein